MRKDSDRRPYAGVRITSAFLSFIHLFAPINSEVPPTLSSNLSESKIGHSYQPVSTDIYNATDFHETNPNINYLIPSKLRGLASIEQSKIVEIDSSDLPTGVYYKDLPSALDIVQQPSGNVNFVSTEEDTVTQFAPAIKYGNIVLLAHNYLDGSEFSELDIDESVYIYKGTREIKKFIVTEIFQYKALDPSDPLPDDDFIDLATGERLTPQELFDKMYKDKGYTGQGRVVFQACKVLNGNANGGLLFVIAEPVIEKPFYTSPGGQEFFLPDQTF